MKSHLIFFSHNIHHFHKLFAKIRECISNGTLAELKNRISRQFDEFIKKVPGKSEQAVPVVPIGDVI